MAVSSPRSAGGSNAASMDPDGRTDGRSAPFPHGCDQDGVLFEWQEANRKGLPVWWLCMALDAAWERLIR